MTPCETDEYGDGDDVLTLGKLPGATFPQYREPTRDERIVEKLIVAGALQTKSGPALTALADAAELAGCDRGRFYDAVVAKIGADTPRLPASFVDNDWDGLG